MFFGWDVTPQCFTAPAPSCIVMTSTHLVEASGFFVASVIASTEFLQTALCAFIHCIHTLWGVVSRLYIRGITFSLSAWQIPEPKGKNPCALVSAVLH